MQLWYKQMQNVETGTEAEHDRRTSKEEISKIKEKRKKTGGM